VVSLPIENLLYDAGWHSLSGVIGVINEDVSGAYSLHPIRLDNARLIEASDRVASAAVIQTMPMAWAIRRVVLRADRCDVDVPPGANIIVGT
jgi:hypothetical protein